MFRSVRWYAGAALVAALSASAAVAQQRPYSPELSCKALENLVASEGALVIDTSPTTYDRYVDSQRFCYSSQETVAAWVPAGDDPECFVGYTCREHDRDRSR